jgi:hypothetical protein
MARIAIAAVNGQLVEDAAARVETFLQDINLAVEKAEKVDPDARGLAGAGATRFNRAACYGLPLQHPEPKKYG